MFDNMIDFIMMKVLLPICILLVMGLLFKLGEEMYENYISDKIELIKKDWVCSKYENIKSYTLSGKILVPIESNECVEYKKKN